MGRILVIGAGGVSTVAVKKIAMNADIFTDIMVASRTKSKCDRIAADIKNVKVQTAQVDADNVEELVTLFNSFKPDLVVNLALPYQDLHIMNACLAYGVSYLDTANYERWTKLKYQYKLAVGIQETFRRCRSDCYPGLWIRSGRNRRSIRLMRSKHHFDEIQYLDIVDCKCRRPSRKHLRLSFNPEINIREITNEENSFEDGEWKETRSVVHTQTVELSECRSKRVLPNVPRRVGKPDQKLPDN